MADSLQQQVAEAIQYHDNQLAWQILVQVAKQKNLTLPREDSLKLNYLRMNSLDSGKVLLLMQESILVAFTIPEFNLEQKIIDYVELLDYVPAQVDFVKKLRAILENHQELIGSTKIKIDDKMLQPSLANWILDFNRSIQQSDRTVLNEIRYLNTFPNPKILDSEQREMLKMILRLYDRLVQYDELWEDLPDTLPDSELKNFEEYINRKFEEVDSENVILQGNSNTPLSPIVPQRQERTVSDFKIPLAKDLDLKAQPRRGLVFDQGTNVDIDETIQKKQEEEIQAKLEDLKQRKKK